MKYYPNEAKVKYDKDYFIGGKPYDEFAYCETQDIFRCQVEMIEDVLGCFNGKMMLEIGGALGWFTKRCQDVGAIAFCQEISEWACENSPIKDSMRCGDAGEGVFFKDNFFDIVTAIESFEHVNNIQHCLSEVSRVLKPNGLLYCSVGLNEAYSHIWTGTLQEWEKLVENTPNLTIDKELTKKIRNHSFCKLQNWQAIIARKI